MRLDEMIFRFQRQLEEALGVEKGLVKVTLSHECFDRAMIDLFKKTEYGTYSYKPSAMSDCEIYGVRIEAREVKP